MSRQGRARAASARGWVLLAVVAALGLGVPGAARAAAAVPAADDTDETPTAPDSALAWSFDTGG
jgi:hypothetical protein